MRFTKILNFREISCKLKFLKNFKNQDNWCLLQPYLLQLFLFLPLGCLSLKILHCNLLVRTWSRHGPTLIRWNCTNVGPSPSGSPWLYPVSSKLPKINHSSNVENINNLLVWKQAVQGAPVTVCGPSGEPLLSLRVQYCQLTVVSLI